MRSRLLVAFLVVTTVGVLGVAADPAAGATQDSEQRIETDHFVITYEEGMEADAEAVASVADEYYSVLFQRFGQNPKEGRLRVALTSESTLPCGDDNAAGCYDGSDKTIYISEGDPELLYHELVHRYQDVAGIGSPGGQQPLAIGIEGTAEYLSVPSTELAQRATFDFDKDWYFTVRDVDVASEEYAQLALFNEFLLHEYGREAFDVLYEQAWYFPAGGSVAEELEAITGTEFSTVREQFLDQRGQQRQRLSEGPTALPGFTYDPFVVSAGTEVTFDARTPGVIEQLGRSWYPARPSAYEWDFDGDGAVDATGPVITRTIDNPADTTVTLYVTVDGQRRKASQDILSRFVSDGSSPTLAVTDITRGAGLTYPADRNADYRGVVGAQATLNASIVNRGLARTETVTLSLANRTVAEQTVELERDSTTPLTLAHTIPGGLEPGAYDYEITVDGRTSERTVYVRQPALNLDWDSIAVPEGNSALLLAGKVRTGERVRLTVDPTATEFDSQVTERVAFSIGDRTIDEREVTFGPGTEKVTVEFDAPSTPGTYQLGASAVDATSPVKGFSRRLTVVDDVALARVENAAGDCSLAVTEIEFTQIFTADTEQYIWADEVSEINPGDEVTYTIHALRNDNCERRIELPVTVGGEQQTVLEEASGTRQYTFRVTQAFGSPGTYELMVDETVLSEINVTADQTDSEADSEETDSDDTTDQTDSTDEERAGDGSTDETESTEDQTDEQDEENQPTEDTTERSTEPTRENESQSPSSDESGPGFGIGAALAGAGAGGYLLKRERPERE
ncbi:hypothetical protein [Halovenus halobia]|uniref:hypothetical protein n=1 Tax=Halovenus halobia TaxID=3396622 RepID=UPI003F545015